jgi:V/A-type H+-transporting ATPase subunit I
MKSIMNILMLAIGAGIILLTIGFLIGIYNAWMLRDWGRVLVDHNGIAGLLLYWSLVLTLIRMYNGTVILPPTLLYITLGIGSFFVTFAEIFKHLINGHRPLVEEGIGTYAIQAFFELFETFISFLSNTLSYVRVGAFAVAHGSLTSVIYMLAGNGGSVGSWVGIIFGNLFIVGFEGLIVGIQTMRLEYYEFFSKFFAGGGTRFEPLKLQSASEE